MSTLEKSTETAPPIAKRLSPEASRLLALEAARLLLIDTGPQAVTLKAVASRVGRTHANLLHHFGSASGLQRALAEYLTKKVCVTIGDAVALTQGGEMPPRQLADIIFNSFDQEGAGQLACFRAMKMRSIRLSTPSMRWSTISQKMAMPMCNCMSLRLKSCCWLWEIR